MGGFFGTIAKQDCVNDLFYGTDYNSHLGTKRAGLVTFDEKSGFHRSIHSLERDYFRSRFEDELDSFKGHQGIGVISDTDPQPIIVNSHLGRYAVVTVAKINNQREIAEELLKQRMHLSEMSANNINQTELVALLINMGDTFEEGINKVYQKIEGSCSMLILTEKYFVKICQCWQITFVTVACNKFLVQFFYAPVYNGFFIGSQSHALCSFADRHNKL